MCVSSGKSVGEIAWRRSEGIGSRGHIVGWLERRNCDTSASLRRQKEKMRVWAVDVVGWRSCVCGGENWLLIVLVLSVKKVSKSSAVIDVVKGVKGENEMFWRDCTCLERCWSCCGNVRIWQCGLLLRKMKATTDTNSGPTDRLIYAIFSLTLEVWSDVY